MTDCLNSCIVSPDFLKDAESSVSSHDVLSVSTSSISFSNRSWSADQPLHAGRESCSRQTLGVRLCRISQKVPFSEVHGATSLTVYFDFDYQHDDCGSPSNAQQEKTNKGK